MRGRAAFAAQSKDREMIDCRIEAVIVQDRGTQLGQVLVAQLQRLLALAADQVVVPFVAQPSVRQLPRTEVGLTDQPQLTEGRQGAIDRAGVERRLQLLDPVQDLLRAAMPRRMLQLAPIYSLFVTSKCRSQR